MPEIRRSIDTKIDNEVTKLEALFKAREEKDMPEPIDDHERIRLDTLKWVQKNR